MLQSYCYSKAFLHHIASFSVAVEKIQSRLVCTEQYECTGHKSRKASLQLKNICSKLKFSKHTFWSKIVAWHLPRYLLIWSYEDIALLYVRGYPLLTNQVHSNWKGLNKYMFFIFKGIYIPSKFMPPVPQVLDYL